ncbi:hypothetical protein ACE6H2_016402 [Prunus campanulata]
MDHPPGILVTSKEGMVCKLRKSLYGLKQSPRAWFGRFAAAMRKSGYVQSNSDHTLFLKRRRGELTALIIYVDDMIVTGDDRVEIQSLQKYLAFEFEMKSLGDLKYFLGIEVARSKHGIFLNQRKYVLDLLAETGMLDCKPIDTPSEQNHKLGLYPDQAPTDKERYQRLVGKLIYLAHTRPDIAYAVSVVSQFMHSPSEDHMTQLSSDGEPLSNPTKYHRLVGSLQYLTLTRPNISFAVQHVAQFMSIPRTSHLATAKCILRYLKGTLQLGFVFRSSSSPLALHAYSDADWAGCPDTRHSTSSYCIFLDPNLISWSAKKQRTVSRSSAESEYRSLAGVSVETVWISNMLHELHVPVSRPTTLYCDNLSATYMASNPVFHAHTKHIELDYHFVPELVFSSSHRVQFVSAIDQTAYLFTKGLLKQCFHLLRSKLLYQRPPSLRGNVKEL